MSLLGPSTPQEGMATTLNESTKKLKSTGVPENVPVAMAIAKDTMCLVIILALVPVFLQTGLKI